MAIVTKINSADSLKAEFSAYNRDYFPFGVYEGLIEFFDECYTDEEPYELDVIGLCCDIQEIDKEDLPDDAIEEATEEDGSVDEDAIIEALEEQASEEGYLLWAGIEDGKPTAYFI